MENMATVKEIQVCGGKLVTALRDMCVEYVRCLSNGIDRTKISFTITLPNKEIKSITFREEDDNVVVYGDFEGLPGILDYAAQVSGKTMPKNRGK